MPPSREEQKEKTSWDSTFQLPRPLSGVSSPQDKARYFTLTIQGLAASNAPALTKLGLLDSRFNFRNLLNEINASLTSLLDISRGQEDPPIVLSQGRVFTLTEPNLRNQTAGLLSQVLTVSIRLPRFQPPPGHVDHGYIRLEPRLTSDVLRDPANKADPENYILPLLLPGVQTVQRSTQRLREVKEALISFEKKFNQVNRAVSLTNGRSNTANCGGARSFLAGPMANSFFAGPTAQFIFPIRRCDDTVADIPPWAKYFLSFDFDCGYWQVELDAESRERTPFFTPNGNGFLNFHAIFVAMMAKLQEQWDKDASQNVQCFHRAGSEVIFDDVILYTRIRQKHFSNILKLCLKSSNSTALQSSSRKPNGLSQNSNSLDATYRQQATPLLSPNSPPSGPFLLPKHGPSYE
jgi:hypothetical protein